MDNQETDVDIAEGVERRLTKRDLVNLFVRSIFLQGSWNFERMQGLGWNFGFLPAIRRFYTRKEDQIEALQRHNEFFNTTPFMAAPIVGIAAAMEEQRANGRDIDGKAITSVKIGLMGPLAGVGDPIWWGTLRPIFGALGASLALTGNILGPILFFVLWNIFQLGFRWYALKIGYERGTNIISTLAGNALTKLTEGAAVLGLFVMGALVSKWAHVNIPLVISRTKMPTGQVSTVTVQHVLDQLMPGLVPLLLTFLCIWLLNKKVNPLVLILGLFIVSILGYWVGILGM
ncbi:PTS system mannose/fructose/sorbose family transporter subunit IID [Alicyclobacillaceae bacterium I2511]|nr:PTS system mannose/fructose/sorbose family transporter subunit IID [Alicyclobacillaceae bacterium I2511]